METKQQESSEEWIWTNCEICSNKRREFHFNGIHRRLPCGHCAMFWEEHAIVKNNCDENGWRCSCGESYATRRGLLRHHKREFAKWVEEQNDQRRNATRV